MQVFSKCGVCSLCLLLINSSVVYLTRTLTIVKHWLFFTFPSAPHVLHNTTFFNLCVGYSDIAPSQLLRKRISFTYSHLVQE